ncbi:hypothetical protein ACS8E9_08115 [Pseudomonas neustonica]|uniref:Uncharacterized protein n=1 Tax=Pseudomonas neustonica TaxID=2487346 RepID=A0ABX9XIU5_9PSED|nr:MULTISPECIES: hypothetical protein [Pseudomonas]MBA6420510.1 hypothetical protein [Pseudomonas sp. 5Ae-yellow]ROZ83506.1 hypothetical protein EF099_09115 [Pseudomonas sp. SSM44]ROZ85364.1 hypothetical protein EF096_07975 [Pseudomonas neustonica]
MFGLSLLLRRQRQYYAQLDQRGRCVALWELKRAPAGDNWARVTEINFRWIGAPLPRHALLPAQTVTSSQRWPLQHI